MTGASMAETVTYASRCTRDHIGAWQRELAQITTQLEARTAQGKEQAMAEPEIRITIDDRQRQDAKREAMTKSLTSSRPTTAELGGPILN